MTDQPDPEYPHGVWVDDEGTLHLDIEDMVRGAGYEPTPDNLRAMEKAAHDMAARIGAIVEEQTDAAHGPRLCAWGCGQPAAAGCPACGSDRAR